MRSEGERECSEGDKIRVSSEVGVSGGGHGIKVGDETSCDKTGCGLG